MHKIQISLCALALAMALFPFQSNAEETITVAWRIKAPYQYLENGIEKGYLLEQVKQIFAQAQIRTQFSVAPSKRIWSHFSTGVKNYCSFDWYKNSERELVAQFSEVLHLTPPYSVLASPTAASHIFAHASLQSLMADPSLTLGIVDSVSYGTELDAMINASKNKIERNNVLPMIMARMVAANRASYMFIDKREWEYLRNNDAYLYQTKIGDLSGTPTGINSYIVCSKDISAEQMQRINAAIQKITKIKK